jgi:hypothetical protein
MFFKVYLVLPKKWNIENMKKYSTQFYSITIHINGVCLINVVF